MKKVLFSLLVCLFPIYAFADAIMPGYIAQLVVFNDEAHLDGILELPLYAAVLFVMNAFISWIEWLVYKCTPIRKISKLYWKVFVANTITCLIGFFIFLLFPDISPMINPFIYYFYFSICFVISCVVEYIFLSICSKKEQIQKKSLLIGCCMANVVSYVLLTPYLEISFIIGVILFGLFILYVCLYSIIKLFMHFIKIKQM